MGQEEMHARRKMTQNHCLAGPSIKMTRALALAKGIAIIAI